MQPLEHTAQRITQALTRLARPVVTIGSRSWSAFVAVVGVGLVSAVLLAMALTLDRGLSVGLVAGLGVAAVATEGSLALLRRVLSGKEHMVFYESFLAIAVVAAALLGILRQPVIPYLEVLLLGVGLLQAVGRMGCFMVGCCHGRPYAWGVCYRQDHAAAGFNAYLVGVPLAPVQLVEMLWALGSVALGGLLVISGAPPGSGLTAYMVAYSLGRFFFEFVRGDALRPYAVGFSEAQWIALTLVTAVVLAGWAGVLPASVWHQAVATGLLGVAGVVMLKRRTTDQPHLLHPKHVGEVARALRVLHAGKAIPRDPDAPPHVVRTSLGVELSGGEGSEALGPVHQYAMTLPDGTEDTGDARALTGIVRSLLVPLTPDPPSIECTRQADGRVRLRLVADV